MNAFLLELSTFVLDMNEFRSRNEHLSAGDQQVENVRSNFSHTHTQLASSDLQVDDR